MTWASNDDNSDYSIDWENDSIQSDADAGYSSDDSLGVDSDENVTPSFTYRSIYGGHCVLSRYLSELQRGTTVTVGWLGDSKFITPLHVPSIVVGHVHERIGVCDTSTTKLPARVTIESHCRPIYSSLAQGIDSLHALAKLLKFVHNRMLGDCLRPAGFSIDVRPNGASDAPLVLGNRMFVDKYEADYLSVIIDSKVYRVPTWCPDKRYRSPCGLGGTMLANSVVLMYPDVPQYMIEATERAPKDEHIGFLCPSSSSSSAALKGLVRFVCTDTVCRCYNMGVGDTMLELSRLCKSHNCKCRNPSCTIRVAGCNVHIFQELCLCQPCLIFWNQQKSTS